MGPTSKSSMDTIEGPNDESKGQRPPKASQIPEMSKTRSVTEKEDQKPPISGQNTKIEARKFSFTNHSSISITPSSIKRKKPDEEEDVSAKPEIESKISPKLNVRQRKAKLEEKCRLARSAKEQNRQKKNPQKESENLSMKDFMDELRGRFDSQDKKLDRNQRKIDLMNLKLEKQEDLAKKRKEKLRKN